MALKDFVKDLSALPDNEARKKHIKDTAKKKAPSNMFEATGGNQVPIFRDMFKMLGKKLDKGFSDEKKADKLELKQETAGVKLQKDNHEKDSLTHRVERGLDKLEQKEDRLMSRAMGNDVHEILAILRQGQIVAKNGNGKDDEDGKLHGLPGILAGLLAGKVGRMAGGLGRTLLRTAGRGGMALGRGFKSYFGIGRTATNAVASGGKVSLLKEGEKVAEKGGILSRVGQIGANVVQKTMGFGRGVLTAAAPTANIASGVAGRTAGDVEKAAAKETTKTVAEKAGEKSIGKLAGKEGLKIAGKKIPGLGFLVGLGLAGMRASKGDYVGAGLEVASGAMGGSGIGIAGGIALDGILLKRDLDGTTDAAEKEHEDAKAAEAQAQTASPEAEASASSVNSPGSALMDTLNSMLALMTDKNKGIYVRPADADALSDTGKLEMNTDKPYSGGLSALDSHGNDALPDVPDYVNKMNAPNKMMVAKDGGLSPYIAAPGKAGMPVATGDAAPILDVIGKGESSAKGYDAQHTSARVSSEKMFGKPVSQLTIGEVKKLMAANAGHGSSSATGRYQIMRDSFDKYLKGSGLKDSDIFNAANQDKLAANFIAPDIARAKRTGNKAPLINKIAAEWASVQQTNGKGRYDGVGPNHARITPQMVADAADKTFANMDRPKGTLTPVSNVPPMTSLYAAPKGNLAADPLRASETLAQGQAELDAHKAQKAQSPVVIQQGRGKGHHKQPAPSSMTSGASQDMNVRNNDPSYRTITLNRMANGV